MHEASFGRNISPPGIHVQEKQQQLVLKHFCYMPKLLLLELVCCSLEQNCHANYFTKGLAQRFQVTKKELNQSAISSLQGQHRKNISIPFKICIESPPPPAHNTHTLKYFLLVTYKQELFRLVVIKHCPRSYFPKSYATNDMKVSHSK